MNKRVFFFSLSFRWLYPRDEPNIARLMGMWSVWMFTVPSLRARECEPKVRRGNSHLFLIPPHGAKHSCRILCVNPLQKTLEAKHHKYAAPRRNSIVCTREDVKKKITRRVTCKCTPTSTRKSPPRAGLRTLLPGEGRAELPVRRRSARQCPHPRGVEILRRRLHRRLSPHGVHVLQQGRGHLQRWFRPRARQGQGLVLFGVSSTESTERGRGSRRRGRRLIA